MPEEQTLESVKCFTSHATGIIRRASGAVGLGGLGGWGGCGWQGWVVGVGDGVGGDRWVVVGIGGNGGGCLAWVVCA